MRKEKTKYWQISSGQRTQMYDDISCIVFRDDDRSGRIIATNVPYPYAKVGDSFWRLTELSPAKTDKLRAALDVPQGVWMVSSLGIGVLFSHFYYWIDLKLLIFTNIIILASCCLTGKPRSSGHAVRTTATISSPSNVQSVYWKP